VNFGNASYSIKGNTSIFTLDSIKGKSKEGLVESEHESEDEERTWTEVNYERQ
jgi:hypothetical protein